MTGAIAIRPSVPEDAAALAALYRGAFPDEDLLALVRALLGAGPGVLSLTASSGGSLAGHVVFTPCTLAGRPERVSLLGPLAVARDRQRSGRGTALLRAGLERLGADGVARVMVLGDPGYYGRFGFEEDACIDPPYPLPEAWRGAWQSLALQAGAEPLRGRLVVPGPWRDPALWAP